MWVQTTVLLSLSLGFAILFVGAVWVGDAPKQMKDTRATKKSNKLI